MYKQNRFFADVQNTVAERFRKTHLIYEEFGLNSKTDFNPHIRFDPQQISNLSEHTFIGSDSVFIKSNFDLNFNRFYYFGPRIKLITLIWSNTPCMTEIRLFLATQKLWRSLGFNAHNPIARFLF